MKPETERYLRNYGMSEEIMTEFKAGRAVLITDDVLILWLKQAWLDGRGNMRRKLSSPLAFIEGYFMGAKRSCD